MIPAAKSEHSQRPALFLLHTGFVLTGIVTTLLGPLLPFLIVRWNLSDIRAGYLFSSQFFGSMLGVAASGVASRRLGLRGALFSGYLVLGCGVLGLASSNWNLALSAVFLYGIGLGVTIPTTNLWVSDANPHRRAAALNILNLAWGAGAVLCPAAVSAMQHSLGIRASLPILAAILFSVALLLGIMPAMRSIELPRHEESNQSAAVAGSPSHVWALLVLGAIFYLYIGTENSVGGWVASYARRSGTGGSAWLFVPSFFWGTLLIGRALAPLALRRLSERSLARVSLVLTALGLCVLLAASHGLNIFVGVVLAGLGLAAVYPIAIASLSHQFGAKAATYAPILFALAGFGGATMPWIVGFVSTQFGSLRTGLIVPLLTTFIMLALHCRRHGRTATVEVSTGTAEA